MLLVKFPLAGHIHLFLISVFTSFNVIFSGYPHTPHIQKAKAKQSVVLNL